MNKTTAKILLIDIETCPNISAMWGNYEQDALWVEVPWQIISFSAKWLRGRQITKCLIDYKGKTDKELVKDIWKLLDEADMAAAHNGIDFDFKKINTRFIANGMPPVSPFKPIDTLKIARRYFAFNSNKLDDLGEFLGLGRKLHHEGKELWRKCMAGDEKAWRVMRRYNKQDVILLEKVYLELLPWMKEHPNLGMYNDELVCPKCGSDDIQMRGYAINQTTKYRRFMCKDCGGWGRITTGEKVNKPIVSI
jgi:hypothetical protein